MCVSGYTNEVGEAFRHLVSREFVIGSYVIATGYVFADAIDKSWKKFKEDAPISNVAIKAADVFTWQILASVLIPGYTINRWEEFSFLFHLPWICVFFYWLIIKCISFQKSGVLQPLFADQDTCPSSSHRLCADCGWIRINSHYHPSNRQVYRLSHGPNLSQDIPSRMSQIIRWSQINTLYPSPTYLGSILAFLGYHQLWKIVQWNCESSIQIVTKNWRKKKFCKKMLNLKTKKKTEKNL